MKKIAIITARGGSKRIPRKNIKDFLGKPIIQYSIEVALNSGLFDEVMVSTDDLEIAEIAISLGARVPFFRSDETSDDFATTADVLVEVLNNYKDLNKHFDIGCCIYPTAPFITIKKLKESFQILSENNVDTVFPIAKFSSSVMWALSKNGKYLQSFWDDNNKKRSQDLQEIYYDSGQFYFFKTESLLHKQSLLTDSTIGYEVSELEVQDIDTFDDWELAKIKYQYFLTKESISTI